MQFILRVSRYIWRDLVSILATCNFPMTLHLRRLVGRNFIQRAGSYPSMLLSEHLFFLELSERSARYPRARPSCTCRLEAGAGVGAAPPSPRRPSPASVKWSFSGQVMSKWYSKRKLLYNRPLSSLRPPLLFFYSNLNAYLNEKKTFYQGSCIIWERHFIILIFIIL